jgi:hypothetical protein
MHDAFDHRAAELAARMRAAATARGHVVSGDDRISPTAAAELLGVATETLRRWRAEGTGPSLFQIGGRITYGLGDLAAWSLRQRMTAAQYSERTNACSSGRERLASGPLRDDD